MKRTEYTATVTKSISVGEFTTKLVCRGTVACELIFVDVPGCDWNEVKRVRVIVEEIE